MATMNTTSNTHSSKNKKLQQRQIDILLLIYRYRFLHRKQIQSLLNHKHFNRINIWLKALTENNYLIRHYTKALAATPAMYSLGPKGRKYLKEHCQQYSVTNTLLNRIWHEKNNSQQFRNKCILLGDIFLSLVSLTEQNEAKLRFYTQVDLEEMQHLPSHLPEAFFSITENNGNTKRFFLVIFTPYQFEKNVIKRVHLYCSYYKKGYWQNYNTHPFPEIIFVCGENKTKSFLRMIIKKRLVTYPTMSFSLTTWQDIQKQGIRKEIFEKVRME